MKKIILAVLIVAFLVIGLTIVWTILDEPKPTITQVANLLEEVDEPSTHLTGSWKATSAVNSVILSIEPSGQALVILLENGAFSMQRTEWKPLPGGLLVEGLPRFRLWQASDNDRLRAEMHLPERIDVSESWRTAPRAFFMQRIRDVPIPKELSERPLPSGWEKAALDKEWDLQAGRRRPKK